MKQSRHLFFTTIFIVILSLNTMKSFGKPLSPISLSGEWNLALDPDDSLLTTSPNSWKFTDSIALPGTTDLAKKGPHQTKPIPYHYHLNREYAFTGPAYYSREITIPENWKDSSVHLFLERVMWQSRVWLDGKEITQPQDSLNTPHIHNLGKLTPGKHQLILRIDNRMIHPIGNKGHAYGNETQSTWNGVVGKIELRAKPDHSIDNVRVFPSLDGTVKIEVTGNLSDGTITATIQSPSLSVSKEIKETTSQEVSQATLELKVPHPTLWSEFSPHLYSLVVNFSQNNRVVSSQSIVFGFRSVSHQNNKLLINEKPAFMRGNLECAVFPKLGHPPVTVEAWKKIWKVYIKHNLNHARFHSWCPPEAAFTAADELGIYLQVEAPIWMDSWMASPNKRLEMDTLGHPKGLGKNDRGNDAFALAEIRRTLDTYGNHPSFIFFCIGNEMGTSNFDVTGTWMRDAKKHDNRHLYAASTARTITPFCDFNATHNIPDIGMCRQHYEFGTNWDYEKNYSRAKVPIIAHEIGQWPVYVDWKTELPKYTGPLKPFRLIKFAEDAKKVGLYKRSHELQLASGGSNRILYRDEIESFLRTPSCRGFQLLGMQDFSGQGEALVGWLDSFYESKGTTDAKLFRQYCAPTVPLLKLPKYAFTSDEHPTIEALLHHYGEKDFSQQPVHWSLTDQDGATIDQGDLSSTNAPTGTVKSLGSFTPNFTKITKASQLSLTLSLPGTNLKNSYSLWVYPNEPIQSPPKDVIVTSDWETTAKQALAKGSSVILIANNLGGRQAAKRAAWMPLYWSVPFFPGQNRDTLGLRIDAHHPAFSKFPTPSFGDWIWYRICRGAHGFDLTEVTPNDYSPIAEPVTDFHLNRRNASIFELNVKAVDPSSHQVGKLLVCGYDISREHAQKLPEVAQLRNSLIHYVSSDQFHPHTSVSIKDLDQLFENPDIKLQSLPKRFNHSDLYVNAAGKLTHFSKPQPWKKATDQILRQIQGVDYKVTCEGIWRDESGSAWFGKSIDITITPRAGVPGKLYIRFHDWNNNGRSGKITVENKTRQLKGHTHGKWMIFPIIREDTNDGQLTISAKVTQGSNLMITDIAFVPNEE